MPLSLHLFSLTKSATQKIKLITWYLTLQAKKRLLRKNDPTLTVTIHCTWKQYSFSFTLHRILDLHVLNEVFLSDEYVPRMKTAPTYILDLGANIGASVTCFSLLFPQAHIAAFEPNPLCLSSLRQNTKHAPTQISINESAVSEKSGTVTFYNNKEHWGGSLIKRAQSDSFEVETVTLDESVKKLAWPTVDLVKIDIEGGEYAVAQSLTHLRPKYIIAEVHPDITNIPYEVFRSHFSEYNDKALFRHGERVVVHLIRKDVDKISA